MQLGRAEEKDNAEALLEWLHSSDGGYFNPNQEFRHEIPGDTSTLFGVFCKNHIKEGDVLAYIPSEKVIKTGSRNRFVNCKTVQLLAEELKKGDKSQYAPYVQSLTKAVQDHGKLLPAYWSDVGKKLFLKITDNGALPPEDPLMENFQWKLKCDKISKEATLLVLTHGEDIGMVPLTDKYNDRAGNYTGLYFGKMRPDFGLEIVAARDLQPGEQIYSRYYEYGIGTPELVRDYGFVEMYPQRWIFPKQRVEFDLIEAKSGGLEVKWRSKQFGEQQDRNTRRKGVESLGGQLERLRSVCQEIQVAKRLPKHEAFVLSRFCQAMITAIEHASDAVAIT